MNKKQNSYLEVLNSTNKDDSMLSEYDKVRITNKISFWKAFFIMMKVTIGMGIFVIPYLYAKNGYFLGSLIIILVGVDIYYCSIFYIEIADHIEQNKKVNILQTYEDVCPYITNNKKINRLLFLAVKVILTR